MMIRRLLHYCSPRARRLVIVELSLVVVAAVLQGIAFLLLVPLLRSLFIGDLDTSRGWLIAVGGTAAGYVAASWFASQIGMKASTVVLDSLLERLGDSVVSLPVSWFSTDRTGLITGVATQGAMFVSTMPYAILRQILAGFIAPGTVLLGMYFFDWRLALTMTVMVPIIAIGYRWLSRAIGRGDKAHSVAVAEASNRVVEFARAQPTLRTAGHDSIADRLVEQALQDQHDQYRGVVITGGSAIAVFAGLVQLSITALLVVGAVLATGGTVDIATLIALLVLGVRFNEPIVAAGDLGGGVAVAKTTIDQLDELAAVPRLPEPEHPATPADFGIEFQGVTFSYNGAPVLRELSFTAPTGAMTAVVGPSGSGKTTITKLIARFYDPDAGTVFIGGVPVPELGTDVIERAVAPVFQDVYLFDDTILNNIWIGGPDLPRDEVISAATRARVDEIVERLPGGWDARVGEGGSNLSGGERQRISIARALLKDAPVVLLDEATSALDIGNEIAIGQAIDSIRTGRTLIVVAHRLQTIMTADRIIMLDGEGGIRESGSHAELLAAGGAYARYWRERVDATGWQLTRHD
ncbi:MULTISPECIES: ABC transporter ATP-binding protein [Nocardiaceae]|uniref:ATP-binding cassette subfamily B protein n=1 Tax=Rhodococcoides corynebacterioides TaxID=53972 RepID=A0ABS2KYJ5_9NOCA|nr:MULTISPECIES: ABC transporter ATP-binding protein [Rhodococcus]MBM7417010.1 ATP-binding cassette subfamily B protein [Rhodococcus corynebacterioides]MBP1115263.1 ATP-binding cassette subfamily B protein [Rhodococcus sp. PvP016]